jgi:predicted chitinase
MGVKINTKKAMSLYSSKGGRTNFPNWLEQILNYAQDDPKINDPRELAYLLATGKVESDYSLQRWEADYVCGKAGVKYKDKPCQSAINYYCSTQGGKQDYCKRGVDKRGLPYFGRGLIQLTWKDNYAKYGNEIGLGNKLADNPELVMLPENSYLLAVAFLKRKRGSSNTSVFDHVKSGNLTEARRRVNGGTKSLSKVNDEYRRWLDVLKNSKTSSKKKSGKGLSSKGKQGKGSTVNKSNKTIKIVAILAIAAIAIGGSIALSMYMEKKKK